MLGYHDVIVVLIGFLELERRLLAVSRFDEVFWLVAVFLLFEQHESSLPTNHLIHEL